MIADDAFVHPDRAPMLQGCPDCGGAGILSDPTLVTAEPEPEPVRVKGKRR